MKLYHLLKENTQQIEQWERVWKSGKGQFVESKDDDQIYYIIDGKRGTGSAWDGGLWNIIDKTLKSSGYSKREQQYIESAIESQDSPFHLEEVEWSEIVEFLNDGGEIEEGNMSSLADTEIEWGYNHADEEMDEDDYENHGDSDYDLPKDHPDHPNNQK